MFTKKTAKTDQITFPDAGSGNNLKKINLFYRICITAKWFDIS